ncbi:MAG: hypothetical protein WCG85_08415 [Polyangia bacterium]
MSTKQDDSFDPSQRRLCPDGSCVGLLGSDGKCNVCGMVGPGGPAVTPAVAAPTTPVAEPEIADEPGSAPSSDAGAAAFDPNRRLCPDDACIGVIGSNNRCSVCGRHG